MKRSLDHSEKREFFLLGHRIYVEYTITEDLIFKKITNLTCTLENNFFSTVSNVYRINPSLKYHY